VQTSSHLKNRRQMGKVRSKKMGRIDWKKRAWSNSHASQRSRMYTNTSVSIKHQVCQVMWCEWWWYVLKRFISSKEWLQQQALLFSMSTVLLVSSSRAWRSLASKAKEDWVCQRFIDINGLRFLNLNCLPQVQPSCWCSVGSGYPRCHVHKVVVII
jgi:hypothetical protein